MFDGIENGMEKWEAGEDAKQFEQVRVGVILW